MNLAEVIPFLFIYISGESISILIFIGISRLFHKRNSKTGDLKKNEVSGVSICKGSLERLFLFVSLVQDIPQSFIVFGALKIATRIKDDSKITNDYFLVGNLISLLIAIGYFLIYKQI